MSTSRTGRRQPAAHSRRRRRRTASPSQRAEMNGVREAVQRGAARIRRAASDAANQVWERLNEKGAETRDRAQQGMESLRDTATGYIDDGRSMARHLETGVERKIRVRPLASLLLAAGVGFLIGAIWRRH